MSQSDAPSKPAAPQKIWWREWIKSLIIAVGIALLIRWPLVEPFSIPSGSMEPTFYNGDRIFVNKFVYGVRWPFNGFTIPFTTKTIWYTDDRLLPGAEPKRWDIVVFKSVEGPVEKHTLVKRIVALPGERVYIERGKIYIDGEALEVPESVNPDPFYTRPPQSNGYAILRDDEHSLVPEDHYLLLGDNSDHSRDGRWFGFVPNHHILGRVSSIWWPVGRWRDLSGFSETWWWNASLLFIGLYTFVRLFVGRSWRTKDGIGDKLNPGDRVFVRFSLGIPIPFTGFRIGDGRPVERGDLLLYRSPQQHGLDPVYLLGVVAGLPEEKVQIRNGKLLVNGKPAPDFPESIRLNDDIGRFGVQSGKENTRVPAGSYYLLSDGGDGTDDSRTLGWVAKSSLIGHVSRVWWPSRKRRPSQNA